MSKKDYQAIARAIYAATHVDYRSCGLIRSVPCGWRNRDCHVHYDSAARITQNLTDALASANPRFDRALFLEACGTGRCKGMPA